MLETVFAVNNLVETVKQYCEWNKTTELSIACKVISVCLQFTPACYWFIIWKYVLSLCE